MQRLLLICLCATTAFAQAGKLGTFTNSGDVGAPTLKGSTAFDAAKREYRITGAGANMWAKEDQFQFVWREMNGNFAVAATLQFLGEGAAHRKAGIMLRQTLDTDSPYIDLVIHGNGMPGVQWRNTKGDITNAFDLPFDGPGKFQIKLMRQGNAITAWVGKDGGELREIGHTQAQVGNPVLVGLAVCSHTADKTDTVVFSDVSIAQLAAPAAKKQ
ncbi:MAG TPA: hypothetical protein VKE70_21380 [Candidatus Solibacter sp.]|nr:hypothetical protein [Candidatus Solibacter sp.]